MTCYDLPLFLCLDTIRTLLDELHLEALKIKAILSGYYVEHVFVLCKCYGFLLNVNEY